MTSPDPKNSDLENLSKNEEPQADREKLEADFNKPMTSKTNEKNIRPKNDDFRIEIEADSEEYDESDDDSDEYEHVQIGFGEISENDITVELEKKFKIVENQMNKPWNEDADNRDLRGDNLFFKHLKDKAEERGEMNDDEDTNSVEDEEEELSDSFYEELIETDEDEENDDLIETGHVVNKKNFMNSVFDTIKARATLKKPPKETKLD